MTSKRAILGTALFILIGLLIFTFANPNEDPIDEGNGKPNTQEVEQNAAAAAVTKAEESLLKNDHDAAYDLVNKLPDGSVKNDLLARLAAIVLKDESTSDNNEETNTVTSYTVRFDSNGGSTVSSQRVQQGGVVTKPQDPTRSGYKFVGWFVNGTAYNFTTKVTRAITLVAQWEVVTPTIVYTMKVTADDGFTPVRKIKIYKDNVDITTQIKSISGLFATYNSTEKTYITDKSEIKANSYSVTLNDNSVIVATVN